MSINLPKPAMFGLAFLLALALYWPLMNGAPIWDDLTFWFKDPVMVNEFSYLDFWKRFTWPLSNTVQKFLFNLWGENYLYYHILNFSIHCGNAYLVYRLGKKIQFSSPFLLFLFFLLSPVCVISAGWLIQIKTLLCFFFGMCSLLAWLEYLENPKWLVPSWIFFLLCVSAKSALITLPGVIVLVSLKKLKGKKYLLILPFFILSAYSAYRILNSPITQLAVNELTVPEGGGPVVEGPVVEGPLLPTTPQVRQKVHKDFFLISNYYYFWQLLLPIDNTPVKGPNFADAGLVEALHLLFLFLLAAIFWKDRILIYLVVAHLMLVPFIGLVPAPFMMVTWVSDQHLYAVLPAFYLMWIAILEKFKIKHLWIIPSLYLVFFSYKTYEASKYYQNEITFYRQSLDYNPSNFAIVYNLSFAYLKSGEYPKALKVVEDTYYLAESIPELKQRRFYDNLMNMYYILKFSIPVKN